MRGSAWLWLMHGQVGERPKGQTWEAGKHECGDAKGCVWRR